MPKNIVLLSDATSFEGGMGHSSNVYKLFNMVEDRTSEQIAFYDRGLGTGWRKLTGNVGGMGISKNILEYYEFILENYAAGDQIYLFGFGRGAITVRLLSGFIHLFGILPKPKSRSELIEAYKIYRTARPEAARAFVVRHDSMSCKIKFLGVWDTVAALDIPSRAVGALVDKFPFYRHRFHDFRVSPSVENAYHALAIDEERQSFGPVLWDRETAPDQKMQQVWFCGVHTDVGGGYKEQTLSNIPLVWMIQMAVKHGLKIYPKHEVEIDEDADGTMHDSRGSTLSKLYRKKVRSWNPETHGKPCVHASVLKRERNVRNAAFPFYSPWIFGLNCECEIEPWNEPIRVIASEEHLKILRQGAQTWNRWREENPDIQPDLTNASLVWANLTECNLSGATLTGADLRGANLQGADLTKTNLEKSKLSWADMSGSKLTDARLHKADLSNANLAGSDLSQAVLNEAFLSRTDFSQANLNQAKLSGAHLLGAKLPEAKLTRADFRRAKLNGADLSSAELSRCSIDEFTEYNDIIGCTMGVNGFWCKETDSAALTTLTPPGNSMQGANHEAVIESLKRARNLHAFSMTLAGLTLYIAVLGLPWIKAPFGNEEIAVAKFGLLAMPISIAMLTLVTMFLADALTGARYLQDRNAAMTVGNFPWVLSRYAGTTLSKRLQSLVTRSAMSFHPVLYIYYWPDWIFPEIIFFILAGLLFTLSVWTFVLSQGFQLPILFDPATEIERQNDSNKLTRSVEELVSLLKRGQAPDFALNKNNLKQPHELKTDNIKNDSRSTD